MGRTVLWLLLLLIAVTVFALSNPTIVTVNFWQWPVYTGPLALVVIGAGVCGALLTYLGSLAHHMRQAQQIRSLRKSIQARETPMASPSPGRPEETHRPF